MVLIQFTFYIALIFCIIFFSYITRYKRYSLTTNKITTPDQALAELLRGNKKYNSSWHFITKKNRKSVATVQRPFAIILGCSDSRVPTEIIFNQLNLGSLFIIRNAGNVVDGVVLGSIEYGVSQLGALLIIVLGHERCGAVTATVDSIIENKPEPSGHIKDIINAISPAAHNILQKHTYAIINEELKIEIIKEAVKENVRLILEDLSKYSQIISHAVATNKIKVVGAYYDLDNGDIQIIS
ncbi:MAG: carbonic anhydrase [Candidatus Dependentiae bacterium]|nr:carbonic anhydrase [Candidatus Dependentiae bacterium]